MVNQLQYFSQILKCLILLRAFRWPAKLLVFSIFFSKLLNLLVIFCLQLKKNLKICHFFHCNFSLS